MNNESQPAVQPESPDSGPASIGKKLDGRIVTGSVIVFLLFLTFFTYYGVPMLVIPYFQAKPGQAEGFFAQVEKSLLAYHSDHGTFPPQDEINRYKRRNKNLIRTRSFGISTYRLSALTTPVAYLDHTISGDPYAMPEQTAPLAYLRGVWDGQELAILFSGGPNLRYDIRNLEAKDKTSRVALEQYLAARSYDPTNGVRSGGDLYRIVPAP